MHWLRAYEGGRGIAYLLAIVGMFAPSVLAMYLLSADEFEARDWTLNLLLATSIGGLLSTLVTSSVLIRFFLDSSDKQPAPTTKERRQNMLDALIAGPVLALISQGMALGVCASKPFSFHMYLQFSFLIAGGFALSAAGNGFINRLGRDVKASIAQFKARKRQKGHSETE